MILLDNFQSRFRGTFLFYAKSGGGFKFRNGGTPPDFPGKMRNRVADSRILLGAGFDWKMRCVRER
jgi:hypothetical protein